jgi:hypothetical protein
VELEVVVLFVALALFPAIVTGLVPYFLWRMQDEVNEQLPAERKLSWVFEWRRIYSEHKKLFPVSSLRRAFDGVLGVYLIANSLIAVLLLWFLMVRR